MEDAVLDLRFNLVGSGKAIHHQFCDHVIAAKKDAAMSASLVNGVALTF